MINQKKSFEKYIMKIKKLDLQQVAFLNMLKAMYHRNFNYYCCCKTHRKQVYDFSRFIIEEIKKERQSGKKRALQR